MRARKKLGTKSTSTQGDPKFSAIPSAPPLAIVEGMEVSSNIPLFPWLRGQRGREGREYHVYTFTKNRVLFVICMMPAKLRPALPPTRSRWGCRSMTWMKCFKMFLSHVKSSSSIKTYAVSTYKEKKEID